MCRSWKNLLQSSCFNLIASQLHQSLGVRVSPCETTEMNDLASVLQSIYGDDTIRLWRSPRRDSDEHQIGADSSGAIRYEVYLK